MYGIEGRTVLLTGGATGIGRRIATRFAEEGCDLGIVDVNVDEAEQTAAMVREAGRRSTVFRADVGKYDEVLAAVDRFVAGFGRVDILANNAGVI